MGASETVYTPADLAVRWKTNTKAIETMLRAGALRGFKVGSRWRIAEVIVLEHEAGQIEGAA